MLRFWISLLLVLFAAPALAADWSHNNRIKPGENRNYEMAVGAADSSMLDARSCGTTVFSWNQDITGVQATADVVLYSCPKADSVVANCRIVQTLTDAETAMAVSEKPGFFFVDVISAPTSTAVARVSAFCTSTFTSKPNYVRRAEIFFNVVTDVLPLTKPLNQPGFTRGYLILELNSAAGSPLFEVIIRNGVIGDDWEICNSGAAAMALNGDDYVILFGGEGYEQTTSTGVDLDCNRALSTDMEIHVLTPVGSSSGNVRGTFYGIPN